MLMVDRQPCTQQGSQVHHHFEGGGRQHPRARYAGEFSHFGRGHHSGYSGGTQAGGGERS